MKPHRISNINNASFVICLTSILLGMAIGGLAIWGVIPLTSVLWRTLGTCGLFFSGSIFSSMAIGCFKTNE